MPILAMIAATALSAAEWPEPPVAVSDYPDSALLKQKSAAAVLDILIDPEGKVVSCKPSGVLGDEQLAADMCKIAGRKKATPARDASGKPAFGLRKDFETLTLPGTPQGDRIGGYGPAPDVDIDVASVPAGTSMPLVVRLTIGVDASGKTTGCAYGDATPIPFGKIACQQVAGVGFDKLTDGAGSPISYVRPVTVRFSLAVKDGG